MIQPIYLYGSEVLRKVAPAADLADKEGLGKLVTDLWETLDRSEGCGLAAPQIGVSLRVAVVNGDIMSDVYPYLKGFRRTFINPVVVSESETECEFNEGCLSVPGKHATVTRAMKITVKAQDINMNEFTLEAEDFLARAIQHEYDHLDGILYVDKAEGPVEDNERE